ncbi:hypothetical protein acdb102_18310 [Acidothermaceae bacterium B102]|nr:hypothetical protein acdb102_18310 [Acidothermaceae bacterium B102]
MELDRIFFMVDGKMELLSPQSFPAEVVLQELLAEHPAVIAGARMTEGPAAALLLVRREHAVRTGTGTVLRPDHLFIDPEGVPVIVEVKLVTNSEIRREIVGQMLDYAANGLHYWRVDELRSNATETASLAGTSVASFLAEEGLDEDEFWRKVEANLKAGAIRMIFVADSIPKELEAIIEYLNKELKTAEVLGVEVRKYSRPSGGGDMFIPTVVGKTAEVVAEKSAAAGKAEWDEDSFFDAVSQSSPQAEPIFRKIVEYTRSTLGGEIGRGRSSQPHLQGWVPLAGTSVWLWRMSGNPRNPSFGINFLYLRQRGVSPERLQTFVNELSDIPSLRATWKGVEAKWNYVNQFPVLEAFSDEANLDLFLGALNGLVGP